MSEPVLFSSNPLNANTSAAAGTATVIVDEVTKLFGRLAAIREISFTFSAGTLYVLLGDNGAGKSTLLRLLAGLSHPTSGKIVIMNGGIMNGGLQDATREQFGYMAHASLLYDELSGMENLEYFARLHGINNVGICEKAMTGVGLDPALTRPVCDYSQGMRQRLSLARAILHSPKVVLLDEPFSNVDAASTAQMTRLLGQLRDSGCTVIVVTHQPAVLGEVGDEFLTMQAGKIVDVRKRAQLRPASTEVGL